MILELFAKTHHLKTRLDSCSESIIALLAAPSVRTATARES